MFLLFHLKRSVVNQIEVAKNDLIEKEPSYKVLLNAGSQSSLQIKEDVNNNEKSLKPMSEVVLKRGKSKSHFRTIVCGIKDSSKIGMAHSLFERRSPSLLF